jgi:putative SOS response-associated peptidase YedK
MCGRFNIISDPLIRMLREITDVEYELQDRFNIAPTEDIPVVLQDQSGARKVQQMRWWLVPGWVDEPSTKYSMFNARSEGLLKSRAFSKPFKTSRCLVPASGYYEWQKGEAGKIPFYIRPEVEDGFVFAGLWDRWQRGDQVIDSCAIITTQAHGAIRHIHDRMPVQLSATQVEEWLDSNSNAHALQRMFVPRLPTSLEIIPVSSYVNNSRNKGDKCVQPTAESQIVH